MNANFAPNAVRAVRMMGTDDRLLSWTPQKVAGAAIAGVGILAGVLLWKRSRRRRRG